MLGKIAVDNYRQGYNCSKCMLKAYETTFNTTLPEQCISACSCVNSGFGFGGFCSSLIGSFMIFGLHFDDTTAKRLRIKLINAFYDEFGSFDCAMLKSNSDADSICEDLIYFAGELVEKLILEEI